MDTGLVRRILGSLGALMMVIALGGSAFAQQVLFRTPQPGDVYREYSRIMAGSTDWRVTDPNATYFNGDSSSGNNPYNFLPNPELPLTVDDLQGATRAELVIDLWGGHIGTYGKKVRFNGNSWIPIPDLQTTPTSGPNYASQYIVVVDVPLAHLHEGTNYFDGRNEGQQDPWGFGWGQHGWNGVILRVYYGASKPHPTGQITSPLPGGQFGENPVVTASAASTAGVHHVDFIAYYDGYDPNGDGVYDDWQYDYHRPSSESSMRIHNHVGTASSAPYSVAWSTRWVPDQTAGHIKLMAKIQDNNGYWYIPPVIDNLSLVRTGSSVQLAKSTDIPETFWVRNGQTKSCHQTISSPVADATSAMLFIRTWNGINGQGEPPDHYTRVNDNWSAPEYGDNHYYAGDSLNMPTGTLVNGTNKIEFYALSVHHGIEILWPGPAIGVRYSGAAYNSPVPLSPALLLPADGVTNVSVNPTLSWTPGLAASAYHLQVATDSLFTALVVDNNNVADTSKAIGPLVNLTTYYWRVRAKNAAGYSAFSTMRRFRTFLASPSAVSPADQASGLPTTVSIVWNTLAGATAYRLQVATAQDFGSGLVVNDSTLTDTTKSVSGLAHFTTYYWHVSAKNAGVWSGASATRSFTTVVAPAAAPVLIAPANGADAQPILVTFRWNTSPYAATYRLQVGTDSTFASGLVLNDSTLTDTLRLVPLSNGTKYYWRVNTKNAGGTGAYSAVWNLTTAMAAPGAVNLVFPAQNATSVATTGLSFLWHPIAGSLSYRFMLASDSTFASGLVKDDSTITDTTRLVSGLTIGTRYFWRVSAKNTGGRGPWSTTWAFRTLIPVPGTVTLVSPPALAGVGADSVRLVWNTTTPGAQRYWVDIGIDSVFSFATTDSAVTDTAKVFHGLVNGTTYYWRVRGGNGGGWGTYSAVRSFRTLFTSIPGGNALPTDYVLKQNYPNPFNPTTRIEFALPREGRVTIAVFNLLGEEVALLVDEVRPAGLYAVQFNAADLASGLYFYRMAVGGKVLTHKMMLVK